MRLELDTHSTAQIRATRHARFDRIISHPCTGLLSELSDQIYVGTAEAIRGGADNGHAIVRIDM